MTTAVFLDYDGTLAGGDGVSPLNAAAISEARRRGALVFIATGRPLCMMPDGTLDLVDGFIGSAGGYIRIGDEVMKDEGIPSAVALDLLHRLEADGGIYSFDAADAIWATPRCAEALVRWRDSDHGLDFEVEDITRHMRVLEESQLTVETLPTMAKAVVWKSEVSVFDTLEHYGDDLAALPSSVPGMDGEGGELFLAHITKATGMHAVLERYGLAAADAVAVGDSHNDIALLGEVGRAFAVEGAPPQLLELAEATVSGPAEGGVAEALRRAGLI